MSDIPYLAGLDEIRPARSLVRALDSDSAFTAACGALMQLVCRDRPPDVLIGIRTGGLVVAEAMTCSSPHRPPVLGLTSRRAGTGTKSRVKLLPMLLKRAPRPVVDRLRVAELRLLSRRRRRNVCQQQVDPQEVENIRAYLAGLPPARFALVVDDAVDSGVTLAAVLQALRAACPGDVTLRSAAITVTLADPLVEPDYALYRGVPCRFPWSFDAAR